MIYELLSKERKFLQKKGLVPNWFNTGGYQLFKEKYEYDTKGKSVKGQFKRIAKTAAKHLKGTELHEGAEDKFFDLMWEGEMSNSTPVLANMGTNRGLPVSCSGTVIDDSIPGFYENLTEVAVLTKHGFGTASDFSHIRPRGSKISIGGEANGVLPVIKDHITAMRNVAQGTARRGAFAVYLNIEHADVPEVLEFLMAEPDDFNIGWTIKQSFIDRMNAGDPTAHALFKRIMKVKLTLGKGYFFFVDKANEKRPAMYKDKGLFINNSQLCSEIMLFNDADHTYTCVLASVNATRFDQIKEKNSVYWMTVFLDCVAAEFIKKAKKVKHLEKAVRFTQKGRALGLGLCGLHTLFQQRNIEAESFEAHMLSQEIQAHIWEESLRASQDMARILGEPEWCKGYGLRNTHRIAIAPTKSTALIMGGISEGIGFDPAMTYTQMTSAGEIDRLNPILLERLKGYGMYTPEVVQSIVDHKGSVQHLDFPNKEVFKTAFEINQKAIIRLASARGKYIDQWQSLNLNFAEGEDEEWIAEVHQEAFEDPNILALYYIYSRSGVQASKGECVACQ